MTTIPQPTDEQVREACEIVALICAGKPVPCGKGTADEYLLTLDDALRAKTAEVEALRRKPAKEPKP
ncbi:MAG: hypothetical protein KGL39_52150 [Patescibacteria group bacterium]|nr:hypothetical protein [Patescibacteria group bacterium]